MSEGRGLALVRVALGGSAFLLAPRERLSRVGEDRVSRAAESRSVRCGFDFRNHPPGWWAPPGRHSFSAPRSRLWLAGFAPCAEFAQQAPTVATLGCFWPGEQTPRNFCGGCQI